MASEEIKLTPNRREVIANLYGESENGVAPMWFGGHNGSHHGATAYTLCKTNPPLVERRYRGLQWGQKGRTTGARGSCVYRLTEAGKRVAKELGCRPFQSGPSDD